MNDPFAWFASCHERIRRFGDGVERLGALPSLADARVPPAAAQAARYFREGLPEHGRDEDLSLHPRLRTLAPELGPVLDGLEAEHAAMHTVVGAMVAALERLAAGEASSPEALRLVAEPALALLRGHLEVEERAVLPVAEARLGGPAREAMLVEMRCRRGLPAEGAELP